MRASQKGHVEIFRELINKGSDINAKTNDKRRRDKEVQH